MKDTKFFKCQCSFAFCCWLHSDCSAVDGTPISDSSWLSRIKILVRHQRIFFSHYMYTCIQKIHTEHIMNSSCWLHVFLSSKSHILCANLPMVCPAPSCLTHLCLWSFQWAVQCRFLHAYFCSFPTSQGSSYLQTDGFWQQISHACVQRLNNIIWSRINGSIKTHYYFVTGSVRKCKYISTHKYIST